jgi:hypothetical protein
MVSDRPLNESERQDRSYVMRGKIKKQIKEILKLGLN